MKLMESPPRFKIKDWITNWQEIGRIKHIHDDGSLDIVIYSREGKKIGRTSPIRGGPSGFEPCCNPDVWVVIEEPYFPLRKSFYLKELLERKEG